jgi:hypothetical protein
VAFYDPCDPGRRSDSLFEEAANDFPIYVPMRSTQDVLDWLDENLPNIQRDGDTLAGVWFYDHASGYGIVDNCESLVGLQFGADTVSVETEEEFWGDLGAALPAETVIHFRHCWVAWDAPYYLQGKKDSCTLGNLALWTNHITTGTSGDVAYDESEVGLPRQLDVPDYTINTPLFWALPLTERALVGLWWWPIPPWRHY